MSQPPAVLLVEDDPTVCDYARRVLEGRGYVVTSAEDGPAALAALATGEGFDVLVVDLALPGADGRAVATAALALRPQARVVLTSGFAPDAGELIRRLGVRFLPTPFLPADLLAAVAAGWGEGGLPPSSSSR
jgi:CheY-like chemotaxis protein